MNMKHIKKIIILLVLFAGVFTSCKKQLDVKNPNSPTPPSALTDLGIIQLAQGSVYVTGFHGLKYGGFYGNFWNDPNAYNELMGDVIGVEAANQYINQLSTPDKVTYGDSSVQLNPQSPPTQVALIRIINTNANASNNPLYYMWAYSYQLNKAMNNLLIIVNNAAVTGDTASKRNTIRAWAYFWKGFAYSNLGSQYYAAIIDNTGGQTTNGDYLTHDKIIAEANANFDKSAAAASAAAPAVFASELGQIIPNICQVGNGGVLDATMWQHNCNTMKARNILENPSTGTPDWATIASLTAPGTGISAGDKEFVAYSNPTGDIYGANGGNIASLATTTNPGYWVTERFIQEFDTVNDLRFKNNFLPLPSFYPGDFTRGTIVGTRYYMVPEGNGLSSNGTATVVYGSITPGAYELKIAAFYEENLIMQAEAQANLGNNDAALKIIDQLHDMQGSGLAHLAGTTPALPVLEIVRRERRIQMAFSGMSFYDARRWGVLANGRSNAVAIDANGKLWTNALINYNYMDYWDVPGNETAYNPAAAGSAAVLNPKYP